MSDFLSSPRTINVSDVVSIVHKIYVDRLCPLSKMPQEGSFVEIFYTSSTVLDILTLNEYVNSFRGSGVFRDLEAVVLKIRTDCEYVLGCDVAVRGVFQLDKQILHVNTASDQLANAGSIPAVRS